jgi:hypothetical protein
MHIACKILIVDVSGDAVMVNRTCSVRFDLLNRTGLRTNFCLLL